MGNPPQSRPGDFRAWEFVLDGRPSSILAAHVRLGRRSISGVLIRLETPPSLAMSYREDFLKREFCVTGLSSLAS